VWPVSVVVVDVVDYEAFELALVPDDGPVEEFTTRRADPTISETVGDWRSDRGLEDLHRLGLEDLIEAARELAAAVADECCGTGEVVGVAQEEVACLLGGPRASRVGRDPPTEHFSAGDVDEEQQVVAAQQRAVDAGEVTRDRGL
jgi:hypothetical protein